jgi:hypothetical protein
MFRKYFEELKSEIVKLRRQISTQAPEITSVSLMRQILGSINVSEKPNEEVFNNRAGAIFKDVIEPKLKKMAREQERFTAAEAANWDQAMFGRGTLNGIELVREEFEKAHAVYMQSIQPKEEFDKQNPLPEL